MVLGSDVKGGAPDEMFSLQIPEDSLHSRTRDFGRSDPSGEGGAPVHVNMSA